jgi:hypothetical protein
MAGNGNNPPQQRSGISIPGQPTEEAALDVAALRVRVELARSHVLDHTLTQRTDRGSLAHGELHSE